MPPDMLDIEKVRSDIPHYGNKLFLNSAGASLVPKVVNDTVRGWLAHEEDIGGYTAADRRAEEVDEFYYYVAELINAQPDNIAFTHDATDAYIKALSSIHWKEGDLIITSQNDYSSNQIQFISLRKRHGIEIKIIRSLRNGDLDIGHFERLIKYKKPKLVAISHIPTNSGLIQDVAAIGKICHKREITYIVDACQSVGQLDVDVEKIQCDFLSATGRKFLRGPRGTGFLYVSDRILKSGMYPLFIDGKGADWTEKGGFKIQKSAKRFETWERPMANKMGLVAAIKYLQEIGIHNVMNYNRSLMGRLRSNLSSIPDIQIYDRGTEKCNILTFRVGGIEIEPLRQLLHKHQIYHSLSTLEWGLLDYRQKGIEWTIRLSPHYFNTTAEMYRVSEILGSI